MLSAISGLQNAPGVSLSSNAIVGITCAILICLFAGQKYGTAKVGFTFAPIVVIWYIANVLIAAYNIATNDKGAIFRALSPSYAVYYFMLNPHRAWVSLSGVFLCVTGTEALFADLGHFSRQAIKVSWTELSTCLCSSFRTADEHSSVYYHVCLCSSQGLVVFVMVQYAMPLPCRTGTVLCTVYCL